MTVEEMILKARLGSARKDAQQGNCTEFAAALYDVLQENGIKCEVITVISHFFGWAHSVVRVNGRMYDSKGIFNLEIYRNRARIHPKVTVSFTYVDDYRERLVAEDFELMYEFYVKALRNASGKVSGNPPVESADQQ